MKKLISDYLNKDSSPYPLSIYRIGFGILVMITILRFWYNGWIDSLYIVPDFHFSYYGFSWVKPMGIYTYLIFYICFFSALFVMLGYKYKYAIVTLFLSFTYIELMDKTTYLNHYYLVSSISFLMIFLPCNSYFSIDSKSNNKIPSYTKVFANTLIKHAEKDSKIVGITAAMPSGTGIDLFSEKFPKRSFDVGIAEQHAITFAGGLATEGFKPYAAIYSTFLQRAYDQVVHDIAIQSLPVRFAIDRAGLVGADGPTHAGSFDITYLSTLPNFIVMAASDEAELVKMINTSVDINDRPCAFRYPRGNGIGVEIPNIDSKLEIGKGKIITEGNKVCILNFGARLQECLTAAKELENKGIKISIIDARFAKPLDQDLILSCARDHEIMLTIEEGSIGGFGSHVSHLLSSKGIFDKGLKFRSLILPDIFIDQDKPDLMYKTAGLDSKSIEEKILDTLDSNIILQKQK